MERGIALVVVVVVGKGRYTTWLAFPTNGRSHVGVAFLFVDFVRHVHHCCYCQKVSTKTMHGLPCHPSRRPLFVHVRQPRMAKRDVSILRPMAHDGEYLWFLVPLLGNFVAESDSYHHPRKAKTKRKEEDPSNHNDTISRKNRPHPFVVIVHNLLHRL